jgi:hypothetical protein
LQEFEENKNFKVSSLFRKAGRTLVIAGSARKAKRHDNGQRNSENTRQGAGKRCTGGEERMGSHSNGLEPEIREVWAENLEEEMAHIRDIVEDYPYIAMVPPPLHN